MTYDAFHTWWWPFVFIAVGGWLATDIWRWLGVVAGNRLKDDSPALTLVRAVATSLVAAVVAKLILYPAGPLAGAPVLLRVGSAAIGFLAFLAGGKRIFLGIAVALACLLVGLQIWPLRPV